MTKSRTKKSKFDDIVTVATLVLSSILLPLDLGNIMQWSSNWYDMSAFNFALSLIPLLFVAILPFIIRRNRVISAICFKIVGIASYIKNLKWHWFYRRFEVESLCLEISPQSPLLALGKNTPFRI